jgi:hypothetical protein
LKLAGFRLEDVDFKVIVCTTNELDEQMGVKKQVRYRSSDILVVSLVPWQRKMWPICDNPLQELYV